MLAGAELRTLCHRVVTHTIQDNDWRLLTEEEYVRRVYAEAVTRRAETESELTKIALTVYSLTMYVACQPAQAHDGPGRYERGHHELHTYLNKCAHRKWPDWPPEDIEDAVQTAHAKVFQALQNGKIHTPAAFLKFAGDHVRGATTAVRRSGQKGGQPIMSLNQLESTLTSDLYEVDTSFASPEEAADRRQLDEAIVMEVRRKFVIHPKAAQQLRAALLRLAFGRSNEEIARRLGVSLKQVSSLIWRGKQKLSQNRELRALYVQWFAQMM
jgi:DNA-directed RNA polymerase specialized sigma24 family protein